MVHPLKTLIVGARGFIGEKLLHFFRKFYPDTIGTHYRQSHGLEQLDLINPKIDFSTEGYAYALIAAGVGSLKKCEEKKQETYQCNVSGPLELGEALLRKGIHPIFFSTDQVFDGKMAVYEVDSHTTPLNEYGRQKAELEFHVLRMGGSIVRLSKVYGWETGDQTLFDHMATKLLRGERICASTDYFCNPLNVTDLLINISKILQRGESLSHLSGPECVDYFSIASFLAKMLEMDDKYIVKIKGDPFDDGVKRPKRVYLHSSFVTSSWREGVAAYVANRKRSLVRNSQATGQFEHYVV